MDIGNYVNRFTYEEEYENTEDEQEYIDNKIEYDIDKAQEDIAEDLFCINKNRSK